jgi:hypothetical protein
MTSGGRTKFHGNGLLIGCFQNGVGFSSLLYLLANILFSVFERGFYMVAIDSTSSTRAQHPSL